MVENLTESLFAEMTTDSPMVVRSRQMRMNSLEGILTTAAYSVSGMPRCSESMSINCKDRSGLAHGSHPGPASTPQKGGKGFVRSGPAAPRAAPSQAHPRSVSTNPLASLATMANMPSTRL